MGYRPHPEQLAAPAGLLGAAGCACTLLSRSWLWNWEHGEVFDLPALCHPCLPFTLPRSRYPRYVGNSVHFAISEPYCLKPCSPPWLCSLGGVFLGRRSGVVQHHEWYHLHPKLRQAWVEWVSYPISCACLGVRERVEVVRTATLFRSRVVQAISVCMVQLCCLTSLSLVALGELPWRLEAFRPFHSPHRGAYAVRVWSAFVCFSGCSLCGARACVCLCPSSFVQTLVLHCPRKRL